MNKIKLYTTLLLLTIFSLTTNGQVTDVLTGINSPLAISIHNNSLFVTYVDTFQGKLLKADLSSPLPLVITANVTTTGIAYSHKVHNNTLFMSADDVGFERYDIATNTITFIPYGPSFIDDIYGLEIYNNDIYYGFNSYPEALFKIPISDLQSTGPINPTQFADSILIGGLAIHNNYLYATENPFFGGNTLVRYDLTQTIPTKQLFYTGVDTALGLIFRGDELYIAELGGNKISMINTANASPIKIDIATNLNGPFALALKGNELYFSQPYGNKVSKISLSPLTINNINKSNFSTLYPNPANEKIYLDKVKNNTDFVIYNSQGRKLQTGKINNGIINIAKIPSNDIYYLIINNSQTIKFIK